MKGPVDKNQVICGRYEVIKHIGEGGMQHVYLSYDNVLDRDVVLKTPKNVSAERRFERSAILSAKINHPNIAKVLDYILEDQRPYLVEEYVKGENLESALLEFTNYLDPYLVAKILHYLAKGLSASHHVGVVHRDLKPTNIMIGGAFQLNEIKITDFGIAKMAEEEISGAVNSDTITSSTTAIGAIPYMAPEAIENPRSVDLSADIWSLGAMTFELLTGEKPFGSGLKAVNNIIEAKISPIPGFVNQNPHFQLLNENIFEIINSCLNKKQENRPSADDLVSMCSGLCYPVQTRYSGKIKRINHNSFGFISSSESDVFFHLKSVYGVKPSNNSKVLYSKYPSGKADRAHPVVLLKEE